MTTQLSVDGIIPIHNLASERRSMMTVGTAIAEMQLVMTRLLAVELAVGRVVIGGGYEEQ